MTIDEVSDLHARTLSKMLMLVQGDLEPSHCDDIDSFQPTSDEWTAYNLIFSSQGDLVFA